MEQFSTYVFKSSLDFASDIYNGKIMLEEAKNYQYKMFKLLDDLKEYNPTRSDKVKTREETLAGVFSLRHLKTLSVYLWVSKRKADVSDKALPNWVKVIKKKI